MQGKHFEIRFWFLALGFCAYLPWLPVADESCGTRPKAKDPRPKTKDQRPLRNMTENRKSRAIWNWQIVKRAVIDSFRKLNPRAMMKNPVMFVVEVGSVLTTL